MGEIVVILIVAILVLGPEKLPSTAVQIAKILKALKRQVDEAKESINQELRISELKEEAQKYKDEFSEYNQNIRKKLSFEEFDELKESIAKEKAQISQSLDEIQKDIESLSPENLASEGVQSAINAKNDGLENSAQNPAAQDFKSEENSATNTEQIELNELSAQISQNTIQNLQNKANSQNEIQKNTVQNLENKQNGIQENINLAQGKSLNLAPKNTNSAQENTAQNAQNSTQNESNTAPSKESKQNATAQVRPSTAQISQNTAQSLNLTQENSLNLAPKNSNSAPKNTPSTAQTPPNPKEKDNV